MRNKQTYYSDSPVQKTAYVVDLIRTTESLSAIGLFYQ